MIGQRLGSYEVIAKLGEGGMGEVFRARDTKLDRQVAIKILPAAFAHDADRLSRFEREARTLAALNHPNIAAIYGVEERDGVAALVMELVEGEDLSQKLEGLRAKGLGLPLEEAVPIARQIAEALEAAHEQGIVHRDLKPANIKLRADGTAKVLDFGLAKGLDPQTAGAMSDLTRSPTIASPAMTQVGTVVGTLLYMSPEQAAGKPVDKRSDIWSYGVVLWEMLAGRPLFAGDNVSIIAADVLRAPIDFTAIPAGPLRRLLERCLDRDVTTRLRDIGEARVTIQRYLANPSSDSLAATLATPAPARPRKTSFVAWAMTGVLVVVAMALAVIVFRERMPAPSHALQATVLPPDGAAFEFNTLLALPAVSPDGSHVVYGARSKGTATQLYVRRLDDGTVQVLPGTDGATLPFWSADSRWIGFAQSEKLKKIAVDGGPAITLVSDIAGQFRGGSWNRDDVILFGTNGTHGLMRTSASGADVTTFLAVQAQPSIGAAPPVYPWFLPDGRHFLYTTRQEGEIPIMFASLDKPGQPGTVVAHAHSNAEYADGHLLFLRENTLMAQPFDPERGETHGDAVAVAEGIPTYVAPSRAAAFTVSSTGVLIFQAGTGGVRWRMQWRDRHGASLATLAEATGDFFDMTVSPDGTRVAATHDNDVWLYDVKQGIPTRFTFSPTPDRAATWSADGATIYYTSIQNARQTLIRKASNGMSGEQVVLASDRPQTAPSASPDGKWLLYSAPVTGGRNDIWRLSLSTATPEVRPFVQSPGYDGNPHFSPQGDWVAYASDESGHFEIYVTPFPGPGGKRQVSSVAARDHAWRRDGKELFYVTDTGELRAVVVSVVNGAIELGRTETLFDGVVPTNGSWAPAADGQKFLVLENAAAAVERPLTIVQNWTARLRK